MSKSRKVSKSDALKALGNKLRPMVYELGFLRK